MDNTAETPLSRAGASASSGDDVTRRMVKGDKEPAKHHRGGGNKYYAWNWVISVFKQMLRMQTWMQVLIAACILSMVSLVPTLTKE